MTRASDDSGLELVLDNRKLIIAFLLLICVCGSFFVVGFVEGKRQGIQEGSQAALETAPPQASRNPDSSEGRSVAPAPALKSNEEPSSRGQLDWYKNVSNKGSAETQLSDPPRNAVPAKVVVGAGSADERSSAAPPARTSAQARPQTGPSTTYSVQVGAFRQRQEAQNKADMLKAKGYECTIEPPKQPEQLFLLKVGKFDSRVEAVSMQLRLKRDGFTTFIKTNN